MESLARFCDNLDLVVGLTMNSIVEKVKNIDVNGCFYQTGHCVFFGYTTDHMPIYRKVIEIVKARKKIFFICNDVVLVDYVTQFQFYTVTLDNQKAVVYDFCKLKHYRPVSLNLSLQYGLCLSPVYSRPF